VGTSRLARRRTTVLPAMTLAEAIETTRIHRVAGRTGDRTAWVTTRPFQAPHHTISDVGLIGGGHVPMTGEVSLAHNGVLFLDELPECRRHGLEVGRQPLDNGVVARRSLGRRESSGLRRRRDTDGDGRDGQRDSLGRSADREGGGMPVSTPLSTVAAMPRPDHAPLCFGAPPGAPDLFLAHHLRSHLASRTANGAPLAAPSGVFPLPRR
jgi:Magnesium chelatase, subunit ChlI